ncbi:MAG: TolC family protein [Bacteroidales bacterium]|nr:TolC family protein [Bacteroidales bacterium]
MHISKYFQGLTAWTVFILLFLIPTSALSQKVWSLDDCINYAMENNLQLKRTIFQAKTTENNLLQSKLEILPSLNGFAQHSLSSGKTVNYDDYTYVQQKFQDGNLGAQATLNVFNGLQQTNIIKRNKFNFLASNANVGKDKNDIMIAIVFAYMRILYNEELLEIAKSQLDAIDQQVVRISQFVKLGKTSQGQLLDIESQAAAERLNLTTVSNQLKTTYLDITQLLNLDSVGDFRVKKPEEREIKEGIIIIPFGEVYQNAVASFPEIKSAEYNLKAEEKNLSIARGTRSPNLYVRGLIYSRYSEIGRNPLDPDAPYPYGDQIKDNRYQQVSINLNIPIFQQWTIQNNISNAKISMLDAEVNLDQSKKILYKTIQQTHLDATSALAKYRTSTEVVESRQAAMDYSQEKMDTGTENAIDYNINKNNLIKAQAELLQAKYEFVFTTKILDFYNGKPFNLD